MISPKFSFVIFILANMLKLSVKMLKFAIMYSVKKSKTSPFKLIYCQYFHLFIIYLY